jgi:hypothetical protein
MDTTTTHGPQAYDRDTAIAIAKARNADATRWTYIAVKICGSFRVIVFDADGQPLGAL